MPAKESTERGMRVIRDVEIPVSDGAIVRADIFRPTHDKPVPAIMTLGPYAKGVPYRTGYAPQWKWLLDAYPDIMPTSSKEYATWETVDPEVWTQFDYACVRVDSRGAGRSPGVLDIFSPRETQDYHDAIEWAGVQSWCTGKVGLCGISYYAINQWAVAALQPPHLAAMIPWEGAADFYRDFARHGGIMSNAFLDAWYPKQVISVQHGNPDAILDPWLQEPSSGPEELSPDELVKRRNDPRPNVLQRPLDGSFYQDRSADWSKVDVPFLSAASWAGFGLHPRGNFEAFTQAASRQKWLECHPGRHEEWFYLDRGIQMQKEFLDHFLKGVENGWDERPPVLLNLRRPFSTDTEFRTAQQWPLENTKWTKMYLSAEDRSMSWDEHSPGSKSETSSIPFQAWTEKITFYSAPLAKPCEITGPLALKLFTSSTTEDADLFVTFQAFAPDDREVDFQGTVDPRTPLSQGWLRASHRKLNEEKSLPYRPYHSHDELQPLVPGRVYEVDVEMWPTNILLPAGYRLALQISGKDFERSTTPDGANEAWHAKGSGPFLHNHPEDRPQEIFGGVTTIHSGKDVESYVLFPVIET